MPTGEFQAVVDAFAAGRIGPSPLLSRRFTLSRVNEAFDNLARTAGSAKIIGEPCPKLPTNKIEILILKECQWVSTSARRST